MSSRILGHRARKGILMWHNDIFPDLYFLAKTHGIPSAVASLTLSTISLLGKPDQESRTKKMASYKGWEAQSAAGAKPLHVQRLHVLIVTRASRVVYATKILIFPQKRQYREHRRMIFNFQLVRGRRIGDTVVVMHDKTQRGGNKNKLTAGFNFNPRSGWLRNRLGVKNFNPKGCCFVLLTSSLLDTGVNSMAAAQHALGTVKTEIWESCK